MLQEVAKQRHMICQWGVKIDKRLINFKQLGSAYIQFGKSVVACLSVLAHRDASIIVLLSMSW